MSGFRHIEQVKDYNTSKSLCNPMDNTIICSAFKEAIVPGRIDSKSDKSAEPSLCVDLSCANGSTPYIDSSNI
jgi:hypothetical protein